MPPRTGWCVPNETVQRCSLNRPAHLESCNADLGSGPRVARVQKDVLLHQLSKKVARSPAHLFLVSSPQAAAERLLLEVTVACHATTICSEHVQGDH